jgi:hypothetical protein
MTMNMMFNDSTKKLAWLGCVLTAMFAASGCIGAEEPSDTEESAIDEGPTEAAAAEESPTPVGDAPADEPVVDAATAADCGVNAGIGLRSGYVQAIANAHCNHVHNIIYVSDWLQENNSNKIVVQRTCYNARTCYAQTAWFHDPAGTQCWRSAAYMSDHVEYHLNRTPCTYH